MWNRADISLEAAHVDKFFIHILINECTSSAWELITEYASPKHDSPAAGHLESN